MQESSLAYKLNRKKNENTITIECSTFMGHPSWGAFNFQWSCQKILGKRKN